MFNSAQSLKLFYSYVFTIAILSFNFSMINAQTTFAVSNTDDSGAGSLRQAILDANASTGTDTINFNISGAGPHTIQPTSALPTIEDPVVINGTTQPGFAGTPIIELDGSNAGNSGGLYITAGGSTVKGLVVNRFGINGFHIKQNGGNVIEGNYIGTDYTGSIDLGNNQHGIGISSSGNIIGGTTAESRNVISGNDHSGIAMWGSNAVNNIVLGNFIGTDVTGIASLGNTQFGVLTGSSAGSNRIGGSNPETGNTIAFNGLDGVAIVDGTGNEIQSNSIFSNEDLGIDLESDGVSSNDAGDGDTGANNLQNFPEIALAGIDDYGDLLVQYNVDSNPTNSTYPLNVQFFQSDPGGEGQTYLGDDSYTTTDYNQGYRLANLGNAAGFEIILGDSIVATATDANGNTSEFSSIAVVATYYLVQTFTRITEGVVVNDEEILTLVIGLTMTMTVI